MAEATHRDYGPVVPFEETALSREAASQRRKGNTPRDRYRVTHVNAEGMRIHIVPVRGLTPKRLMRHRFNFQIPPLDQFGWQASHTHSEFETIGDDTFSRSGARQLMRVDFETVVMDGNPGFAVYHGRAQALDAGMQLKRISNSGKAFRLICGQERLWGRPDINMLATLRDVRAVERAGEPDARYFSLSFVQYREAKIKRRQRKRDPKLPTTVRVYKTGKVSGAPPGFKVGPNRPVTLARLARVYYGNTKSMAAIRRANPRLKSWPGNVDLGLFVRRQRAGERLKVKIPDRKS